MAPLPKVREEKKEKPVTPKSWLQMSHDEQCWLKELWSGSLLADMRRAEGKCSRVQAKDFVVDEEA